MPPGVVQTHNVEGEKKPEVSFKNNAFSTSLFARSFRWRKLAGLAALPPLAAFSRHSGGSVCFLH
jgi:hypothetical protein